MIAGETQQRTSFWRSWPGIALCGFIAIGALARVVEQGAHALQWLPVALLLACPLMHLFHGHGSHGGHHGRAARRRNDGRSDDEAAD